MSAVSATKGRLRFDSHPATIRMYAALVRAGFRRYATYRQAMVAGAITNSVFGILRCSAILAVAAGAGGTAAGYDPQQLATFVFAGQGLVGAVLLWARLELPERIRSGAVVTDLLRPVNPVLRELCTELGRAGYGVLTKFVFQILVGSLLFTMFWPDRPLTYLIFIVSGFLAILVCFAARYLISAISYWLLDARGPESMWMLLVVVFSGITFPVWFLPHWLVDVLMLATPLPSIVQIPLDVFTERYDLAGQLWMLLLQLAWAAGLLLLCNVVQHRAERRMVVQGG